MRLGVCDALRVPLAVACDEGDPAWELVSVVVNDDEELALGLPVGLGDTVGVSAWEPLPI